MGFQVLTAASMKMTVFWGIGPCSVVEVGQHFRGTYWRFALMMEAVSTVEMSVSFYETTRRSIPGGCHLLDAFIMKSLFTNCILHKVKHLFYPLRLIFSHDTCNFYFLCMYKQVIVVRHWLNVIFRESKSEELMTNGISIF
jgi:hypothetical protein